MKSGADVNKTLSESNEPMTMGSRLGFHPETPFLLALLFFLLLSCSPGGTNQGETSAEGASEAAAEAEHAEEVHLEPGDAETWDIAVGPVEFTDVTGELELPGVLTTNQNRTARISPLVAGQIASVMVDLGRRVERGQTLAELNAPEFTRAQTEFLQAAAQAKLSQKDFERARGLRAQQAIEEREFLRRESIFEQDMARMRAAEVMLHSLGVDEERMRSISLGLDLNVPLEDHSAVDPLLAIRSPLSGTVLTRDAVLGDYVDPDQVIFTVSDLSSLWAELDAYEQQLPSLASSADVVIRSPLFPDQDFPGRITFISDEVDEELRTIGVRVEVPNAERLLKPNMYVNGFMRVRTPGERHMVVPPDAVQLLEGRQVVFVEEPAEPGEDHRVFQAVDVVPGETLTIGRIVLEGLEGSETIVTRGAFTLKAEMTKGAGGHQHVH